MHWLPQNALCESSLFYDFKKNLNYQVNMRTFEWAKCVKSK